MSMMSRIETTTTAIDVDYSPDDGECGNDEETADILVVFPKNSNDDRDEDFAASSNHRNLIDDEKNDSCCCIRRKLCYPSCLFRWAMVILLSLAVILPLEIVDVVYRDQSPWIRLYGIENVGNARWCEAINADVTQFIIEPWNSRSDYAFMVWGCFLVVLGILDFRNLRRKRPSSSSSSSEQPEDGEADLITAGVASGLSSSLPLPSPLPREEEVTVPNPLLRYPHITIGNGVFNLLHGLGSFWNHACECSDGGRADSSGMLSVIAFPLAYTPVQLLVTTATMVPSSSCTTTKNLLLSMLPPVCQALFFFLVWEGIVRSSPAFEILVGCAVGLLPASFLYLYCWRNKRQQQRHRLRWWLFPVGLACFGFATWAWNLDVRGIWCFQEGILVVLQGHAVWHYLSAVVLVCMYCIYRSEQITVVVENNNQ